MERSVELDIPKYTTLLRILNLFKDISTDVVIQDGIIRQKTNDKFSIFEIDLRPLLGDITLPINFIKNKFDIFKSFSTNSMVIKTTDSSYIFTDTYSKIEFKYPHPDMLTNGYIKEEELVDKENESNDNIILSTSINKVISSRMKVTSQSFETNAVKVTFNGGDANISAVKASKDNSAVFIQGIVMEKIFKGESNFTVAPFICDHDDDLIFKIYENGRNRVLAVFSSVIDDINVKVYTRAATIKIQEDDEE